MTMTARMSAMALALGGLTPAAVVAAGPEFVQIDSARNATTLVIATTLPPLGAGDAPAIASLATTRWRTGEAGAVAAVARWRLGAGGTWMAGLGPAAGHWRSRDATAPRRESGLAARAQLEWIDSAADGGLSYGLVQATSFRQSRLVTLQHLPGGLPLGLELSHYRERGFDAATLAARWRLGAERRWSLRAGFTHADAETRPFVGLGYNGF